MAKATPAAVVRGEVGEEGPVDGHDPLAAALADDPHHVPTLVDGPLDHELGAQAAELGELVGTADPIEQDPIDGFLDPGCSGLSFVPRRGLLRRLAPASVVTRPAAGRYNPRVSATRFRGGQIMGIRIATLFDENDAKRCAGCNEPITGTPFRVSLMDTIAREAPPTWARAATLNPGPHQFHADPEHFRAWARVRGYYVCRRSEVRELMRPVPLPIEPPAWGVCDANHRDDHEFVPA